MRSLIIVVAACLLPASLAYGPGSHHGGWGGPPSAPQGLEYNGLRVKYGPSDEKVDTEYFFKMPRTVNEAALKGWRLTERPPGPMPGLKMFCAPGRAVCPLFNDAGLIAGLQVAMPVDAYEFKDAEKKFVRWHAPADGGEPAKDYWTLTQFYVSEASSLRPQHGYHSKHDTIREGGVWVTGPDGKLLKLPTSEAQLNSTAFTKQQCIPNMGNHYYYEMSRNLNCDNLFPWFGLTTNNQLIGVGVIVFGRLAPQQPRHYFEMPPIRDRFSETIIPDAPECLWDYENTYGLITLHIYFIDDPWTVRCK